MKMNINSERLWNNIYSLGKIGKNDSGGNTRLSFTEEEKAAKEYVQKIMLEAGMDVFTDQIGNLHGIYKGLKPELSSVLVGSHVDSVINGGIFDGPAGVLTGVEAIKTLNENKMQLDRTIEVLAFTDEEGARFSTGMLGSQAFTGQLKIGELEKFEDADGITIAKAMRNMGYDPAQLHTVKRDPATIKAYVELHIEQGKILESHNTSVGVVTGIAGPLWLKVSLNGEAGHAGTTPMSMRKDPMVAAAQIMTYLNERTRKEVNTVGTVGQLSIQPGGINIIPEKVEFTMDIRDISEEIRNKVAEDVRQFITHLCEEFGIGSSVDVLHDLKPVLCSDNIIQLIERSCDEEGLPVVKLPSGAGHDAMMMANITDIGMIFIRSKDGISHNPKEWSEKADLANGAQVLLNTLIKLANN
jgi:allantoate deiminase